MLYPSQGSLTTGKGNRLVPLVSFLLSHSYFLHSRFVLASTQELHEKIALLSSRIRELEDGLRTSHASNTNGTDPHPLLTDELLQIKAPIQREGIAQLVNSAQDDSGADVVDSFGSLAISDTGRTSYFGQATSSWVRVWW